MAMQTLLSVVLWRLVMRRYEGPSSYYGPIPVCEGYRVEKNVRWWAESMNKGVEAYRAWQKGFLWTRENPL